MAEPAYRTGRRQTENRTIATPQIDRQAATDADTNDLVGGRVGGDFFTEPLPIREKINIEL